MATPKLFGYLPDPRNAQDEPLALKFGSLGLTGDPPTKSSLRSYAGPILLQENQDCVAHAIAYAEICEQIKGGMVNPSYLSRRFVYWNARNYHQATLLDEGTFIRFGILGLEKLGFPEEKDWPYDIDNWSEQPSALAYHDALDQAGVDAYYRIDSLGASRVIDVRRAIANGWAIVWGTSVWQALLDMKPGDIIAPGGGEVLGGHAMCCLEYDETSFRGPQSWGMEYGDDGWYAVTPQYMADSSTQDVWAVKFGMRYTEPEEAKQPQEETEEAEETQS